MYRYILYLSVSVLILVSCKSKGPLTEGQENQEDFIITFGSCNKPEKTNVFWDDILALRPNVFIWGGDIVYADTDDIKKIKDSYTQQNAVPAYAALKNQVLITGTWDDHDYGLNDGGTEFDLKQESQQVFLDFMDVSKNDIRRGQEGVYSSQLLEKKEGSVKIINLDTRYFRTALTDSPQEGKRYQPNPYGEGTILGDKQWNWLQEQLENSEADFNLIVSSIQFLSNAHGYEKWANHPHEVDKLKQLIKNSNAKGVIILSGDRHISEFSKTEVEGLPYPLIDFTSSGLTHSYADFKGEPNPYRSGDVVFIPSYGALLLNAQKKEATLRIMGENGTVLQELKQRF